MLELVENLGEYALAHMISDKGTEFIAKLDRPPETAIGDRMGFTADPALIHRFDAGTELRIDEERCDLERYLEWLYTGCVSEQHAEALFVLADRMSDVRLQVACSQQMMAVRNDTHSWFGLVGVASVAAAGVLVLAGKVRLGGS